MTYERKRIGWMILAAIAAFFMCFAVGTQPAQAMSFPRVVAHGCGSIDGYATTNSQEALQQALKEGFQWIEVDLALTADGEIALIHDWIQAPQLYLGCPENKRMKMNEFLSYKVYQRYTPLNAKRLEALLKDAPTTVRIITDTKDNTLEILEKIAKEQPALAKRLIPQIYSESELQQVRDMGYQDVILTMYRINDIDDKALVQFVKSNQICAVTVSEERAKQSFIKRLQNRGVPVYAHTINSYETALAWRPDGIFGVYSDTLQPRYFTGLEKDYYLVKEKANGSKIKLDEEHFTGDITVWMKGKDTHATVCYTIDGTEVGYGNVNKTLTLHTEKISAGKHILQAEIVTADGKSKGKLQYLIWLDAGMPWIADQQFAYVIDQLKPTRPFEDILKTGDDAEAALLKQCLIAKRGSFVYYNNGQIDVYRNAYGFLKASMDYKNRAVLPFTATGYALGASSIVMNGNLEMEIRYQGINSVTKIDDPQVTVGGEVIPLERALVLQQNKAMAGGDIFKAVFRREVLEQNGLMIILPEKCNLSATQQQALLQKAKLLY